MEVLKKLNLHTTAIWRSQCVFSINLTYFHNYVGLGINIYKEPYLFGSGRELRESLWYPSSYFDIILLWVYLIWGLIWSFNGQIRLNLRLVTAVYLNVNLKISGWYGFNYLIRVCYTHLNSLLDSCGSPTKKLRYWNYFPVQNSKISRIYTNVNYYRRL